MTPRQIMRLPYIQFVIGMLDAPAIDYDSKKKKKDEVITPKDKTSEINAITSALG